MTRLDWSRTDKDMDGYDAGLAREWSMGPTAASFDRPDGTDELKLLSPPTIYWARELARAFPVEDEASHVRLFVAAGQAAATLYYRNGWAMIRQRVQAVHLKASTRAPFPSAFYAIYFDHWAMTLARGDHLNRIGSIPRHIDSFSMIGERWTRALVARRALEARQGELKFTTPMLMHERMTRLYADREAQGGT